MSENEMLEEIKSLSPSEEAILTMLIRYQNLKAELEKEKEKNKSIDEFCRKELAFKRRLQRENRQPDEFNQGRFYVSENIRKIIGGIKQC